MVGVSAPLTLAVTSSTGVMSVALGRGAQDAIEIVVPTDRRHAEEMGPRIQELLDTGGVRLADVERLAVDIGPGRFTGLRVGLATVRALAFALDVPVVGLTSLAVLAAGAGSAMTGAGSAGSEGAVGPITAVVDARRAEVFQQTFVDGGPVGDAVVDTPEVLAADAAGLVVGDGADRYADQYRAVPGLTVVLGGNPSAATMLALAGDTPGQPGTEIKPLYLRDPDAKPNIKTRPVEGATP